MSNEEVLTIGQILLIDDDDNFRESVAAYLELKGLNVISAPSAMHACKFIETQPWNWYPAFIITEIVMNGMSGYEFIRRVENMFPKKEIPVIVVSKLTGTVDIMEAQSAGAKAYITKPVNPEKLYEHLVNFLSEEGSGMQLYNSI